MDWYGGGLQETSKALRGAWLLRYLRVQISLCTSQPRWCEELDSCSQQGPDLQKSLALCSCLHPQWKAEASIQLGQGQEGRPIILSGNWGWEGVSMVLGAKVGKSLHFSQWELLGAQPFEMLAFSVQPLLCFAA